MNKLRCDNNPPPITSSQYFNYSHTPGNSVLTDSDEDSPSQTSSRYSPETFVRIHKSPPYCQISQKSYPQRTYLLFSLHALCSPASKEIQWVKELLLGTSSFNNFFHYNFVTIFYFQIRHNSSILSKRE